MPWYEFQCERCDDIVTRRLTVAERDSYHVMCSKCYVPMHRIPTAANFKLIGKGFHQNDYPKRTK